MNTTANKLEVAETIRAQLGPGCFALLGASQLVGDENALQFSIKGCKKGNKLRIVLDPSDTYTVELWKFNRKTFECDKVSECSDVYADSLHRTIESLTGLCARF